MKIGYNKVIVSLPILLAILLGVLTVYADKQGIPVKSENYFIIAGLIVLALPMFFVPYIKITDTEIIVNNQFGMPRRRMPIKGYGDIKFENGNIMVNINGTWQKLFFMKLLADPRGLRELKGKVGK